MGLPKLFLVMLNLLTWNIVRGAVLQLITVYANYVVTYAEKLMIDRYGDFFNQPYLVQESP